MIKILTSSNRRKKHPLYLFSFEEWTGISNIHVDTIPVNFSKENTFVLCSSVISCRNGRWEVNNYFKIFCY